MAVSDYQQQMETVEAHFLSNYTASPMGFDNVPVLSDGEKATHQPFIKVSLRGLTKTRLGFGSQFEHSGTIFVQVYTAKGTGAKLVNSYCDALDALIELGVESYQFGEPIRGGSAPETESQYIQSVYTVGYLIN